MPRRIPAALAAMVLAVVATPAFAASAVCSSEFEDYAAGYAWRGTILADDGRLYDFEVASLDQAGAIAGTAARPGGARGAFDTMFDIAAQAAAGATPRTN